MSTTHTPWPRPSLHFDQDWDGTNLMATITDIVIGGTVKRIKTKPIVALDSMDDLTASRIVNSYTGHHDQLHKEWGNATPLCPTCDGLLGYSFSFLASNKHQVHISQKACWYCAQCDKSFEPEKIVRKDDSAHAIIDRYAALEKLL